MKLSIDTNLFIYAADPDSPNYEASRRFFDSLEYESSTQVCICGLVLTKVYMQLRNPAIFKTPYSNIEAVEFCQVLKSNPEWTYIDYSPEIFDKLLEFEYSNNRSFRKAIDTRIALTLRHHHVTHFATVNIKDFEGFGFDKVWNPLQV